LKYGHDQSGRVWVIAEIKNDPLKDEKNRKAYSNATTTREQRMSVIR
jgi:hypothetical protein